MTITVTQRNLAVIDFVTQFFRNYQIPIGGLDIRYQPAPKNTLNVIVKISGPLKPSLCFLVERTSEGKPWGIRCGSSLRVCFPTDSDSTLIPPDLGLCETELTVKCDSTGYYQFKKKS